MSPIAVVLAPGSLNHIANIVKGYAIAIGVAFAIWFVWQWWRSRQTEMKIERAVRAKSAWARHLALAQQHPELAEPAGGTLAGSLEAARYRAFVGGLLATADEILMLDPSDAWRGALARHLASHRSYLASADFRERGFGDCSEAVRALLDGLGRD